MEFVTEVNSALGGGAEKEETELTRISESPYVAILTSPMRTVGRLNEAEDRTPGWLLVASASLCSTLLTWLGWSATAYIPAELTDLGIVSLGYAMLALALLAPVLSLVGWLLSAAVYRWVGRWLGGHGTTNDVRRALAWSAVGNLAPVVVITILPAVFPATMTGAEVSPSFYVLTLLQAAAGFWGMAITAGALAAAHNFSRWRGLTLFLLVPLLAIAVVLLAVLGFGTLFWLFRG